VALHRERSRAQTFLTAALEPQAVEMGLEAGTCRDIEAGKCLRVTRGMYQLPEMPKQASHPHTRARASTLVLRGGGVGEPRRALVRKLKLEPFESRKVGLAPLMLGRSGP
jgi:hypothetical protein